MGVYACGANLHGQVEGTDQLQPPSLQLVSSASSLVAACWSCLVVRDNDGALRVLGLPLEGNVVLEDIEVWLGHDSFVAGLRRDGRVERFADGARTEERYSLASMNSRGEILLVPSSSLFFPAFSLVLLTYPSSATTPHEAHLYSSLDALLDSSSSPLLLSLPSSSPSECITTLSTGGAAHFLLLSSPSQTLYAWGDNRYGQCGPVPLSALAGPSPSFTGDEPRRATLPKLDFFDGLFPSPPLSSGAFHSAVRTRDGSLYVFGSDKEGQLGMGGKGGGAEPELVADGEEGGETLVVREVACGAGHTVMLTEEGEVWVAGANQDGQLGLSDFLPRPSFVKHLPLASLVSQLSSASETQQSVRHVLCTRWACYFEVS
ncbi:hypothetical protein JCM8547_005966 [Rhodosporidiobolus lusitaniae]